MKDSVRFAQSLTNVEGRLTYKALINTPDPVKTGSLINGKNDNVMASGIGVTKPVYQLFDGEIVAKFDSLTQASELTGIKIKLISKVLRGRQATTKGYQWVYA